MKERVTKFDLENAFKALDEIAIPKVSKVRPNRPNLKESVKRVDRTSMLVEDYYDLYNREDVNELKEDREAEIASAKLAKIEKIVDLDAESPEDLQPTYVGKTIIQCPQCLTLFYKDPADIIVSEENPDMVNVDEVCQHCGNDSGYTIIGKVAEEEVPVDELPQEAIPEDIPEENDTEVEDEAEEDIPMTDEEPAEGEESTDLDLEAASDESVEEEPEEEVKESLNETYYTCAEIDGEKRRFPFNSREEARKYAAQISAGEAPEFKDKKIGSVWTEGLDGRLNEDVDLNKQLDLYNDFIKYLQKMVEQDEDALAEAKKLGNKEVIAALEKRLESSRAELKAALPEAVKDEVSSDNLPSADEVPMEDVEEEKNESLEKTVDDDIKDVRVDAAKGEVKKLEENLNEAKAKKVYNTYTNIMWDLVGGRVEKDEKGRNIYSQGCGYTVYDTGVDKDDNITVFAKTKEGLNNAIEVAKKYNHEYLGPMEAGHKRPGYYMIAIIVKPEDYEDGAFEESLKAGSLQEALHKFPEIGVDELDNFFKVCDKIGIKTMADLQRFKQEYCPNCEDLLKALNDYAINELGIDFKIKEGIKKPLKEEDDLSDAEFAQLLNSNEFKTPISETEVEAYLDESATAEGKIVVTNDPYYVIAYSDGESTYYYSDKGSYNVDFRGNRYYDINRISDELDDAVTFDTKDEAEEYLSTANKYLFYFYKYMDNVDHRRGGSFNFDFSNSSIEEFINWLGSGMEIAKIGGDKPKAYNVTSDEVADQNDRPLYIDKDLEDADGVFLKNIKIKATSDKNKEEEVKFDEIEDFQEQLFNEHVTKYLNEVYSNVEGFETTNCTLDENKFIVEGNIKFKSGKTKKMSFDFKAANKGLLEGYSKNIPVESKFTLKYNINKDKALVTESLAYKYKINGTEVSGETK